MSRIYVAVDLETTGLEPKQDAILEIGAVKFRIPTTPDEEPIIARWSTLVNPNRPIPYNISRLTGIQQNELDRAPLLADVLKEFSRFVGNYPIIGHHVAFELAFLQRHGQLVGQAHLDTFELASLLLPSASRYSLGQLATFLGFTFDNWHRALADAEMTAHLFLALWNEACGLPKETLESIVDVALNSRWRLRSFFSAALRAGESLHPPLLRSLKMSPLTPTEALMPVDSPAASPVKEMVALLEPGGAVAEALPDYEANIQQMALLETVTRAFAQESHLILEAAPGSQRRLAYAISAIYEALRRGETVVLASRDFHKQDHFFYKELPLLAEQLPFSFSAYRLKEQAAYLCPSRVEMLRQRGNFTPVEARLLARLLIWMQRTETGDRFELNLHGDELQVWKLLCADETSCQSGKCQYWQQARQMAKQAHLLLVHQDVLLADLAAGGGILPPYQMVIIDDAHHLEEQATRKLKVSCQESDFEWLVERLMYEDKRGARGILPLIRQGILASHLETKTLILAQVDQLAQQATDLSQKVEGLFVDIGDVLQHKRSSQYRYHIQAEWREEAEWQLLTFKCEGLAQVSQRLMEGLEQLATELESATEASVWQLHADDCRRIAKEIGRLSGEVERILIDPEENDVTWVRQLRVSDEKTGEEQTLFLLRRSPVNVAPLLRRELFDKKRSVILTSQALATEGGFTFMRERLGIEGGEELSIDSPYHFSSQALVYLVKDLPAPNQQNYSSRLHRALIDLAQATEGRMLVLFTSKSQLHNAYRAISPTLARDNIVVLAQYFDGPRTQLIERFGTVERAVLLGTHAFWEGVEVAGAALSCIVITRLPFPAHTEPIQVARGDAYRDPFIDYRVPQAILRFRLGVGQLLRSKEDRGIVALLDSRIHSKRYGQAFLESFPATTLKIGPFRNLPPLAERWLKNSKL